MDADKNNLKKLFSEGDPGLPPELNWEQMEDGIMEKMEASETPPSSDRTNSDVTRIVFTLLLCLLPVLFFNNGLLMKMVGDASDVLTDQPKPGEPAIVDHTPVPASSLPPAQQETAPEGSGTSARSTPAIATKRTGTETNQMVDAPNKVTGSSISDSEAQEAANVDVLSAERQTPTATGPPLTPQVPSDSNLQDKTPLPGKAKAPIADAEAVQKSARLLPLSGLPTLDFAPQRAVAKMILSKKVVIEPKADLIPTRQLSLLSGVSNWNPGYGEAPPENALYEQAILSYYTQLSYTHRFGNNYTLTAGLQYQQLETQLQWSQRIEDYTTVTLQDTIVEIQISSLTGSSTEVRGDVDVSVDATRNVRHYNQYRLVQIPVLMGKSWVIGEKWQAGVAVGSAINVLSQNKGRYVYQGELQQMGGAATSLIDNRWGIHGLAMGRLGYQISKQLGVMIEAQYQKSITNWGKVPGFEMRPEVLNLGVGVFRSF